MQATEYVHMLPWNGGICSSQKEWLIDELAKSAKAGEDVIVACHHPVGLGSAEPTHMAWNAPEIEQVLTDCPNVRLVLSGHCHRGGYSCIQGKHFVTLEALLEAPPGSNSFGTVHVYKDRIEIAGTGTMTSRVLKF